MAITAGGHFRLKTGDAVALIAPASGQKSHETGYLNEAVELLTSWGLVVKIFAAQQPTHYLAANDDTRATQLNAALTDPTIKAIFVTRGGYGCARIVDAITPVSFGEKWLVGFSDITTLHLCLATHSNIHRVHGPNLATAQFLAPTQAAETNRQQLYHALFTGEFPKLTLEPLNAAAQKHAQKHAQTQTQTQPLNLSTAPLTGGCLSVVVTTLGTPFAIDTTNKILMLEETNEPPFRIDRMLTHLALAGKLTNLQGLVFGEMQACHSPQIDLFDILKAQFADAHFPVYCSPDFGHGARNLCWRYDTGVA